jgi:threonine dehydrogenase-like Zn-dependent dehydrogenase
LTLCYGLQISFHGTELAEVSEGKNVIVWGAGPVGMMAAYLAKTLKKAARVIIVDCLPYRLEMARKLGLETLNFEQCKDSVEKEIFARMPGGADCTIECVGFRFPRSWMHKFMRATKMESDSCEIIRQMVVVTKKGGNIVREHGGHTPLRNHSRTPSLTRYFRLLIPRCVHCLSACRV